MKKSLDEELANAVNDTDGVETEGVSKALPARGDSTKAVGTGVSIGLLAVLLCMGGGIVALVLVGFKDAAVYAMPTDQLLARATELQGRKVRIDGELVPGTLQKRDTPCEFRFTMQSNKQKLNVVYPQCVIPDTFRDRPEGGVQVTVEGSLNKGGAFDASSVMAKCSSKYDPKTHEIIRPDGTRVKAPPSANLDSELVQ
jgi:cytochrome c-type biogenesis protein CcmE